VAIGDDRREALRLVAPLEDRGAEMDVVDVQRGAVDGDVDALKAARLAGLPREIVFEVVRDRKAAEHRVAELMAAQLACGRHHPSHAERGAEFFRVPAAVRPRPHDFLQRDDVGVDGAEDGGNAVGTRAAIDAAAAVDVVGRDAKRRTRRESHYCYDKAVVARATLLALVLTCAAAAACRSTESTEPLQLDRNVLTVDNRSPREWTGVEIWLNTHYRVTTPSIPPKGRFQVSLDSFVNGYGQRFNFNRMQVTDLRLTAKLPDGHPLEVKKEFRASGLAGALGGFK